MCLHFDFAIENSFVQQNNTHEHI